MAGTLLKSISKDERERAHFRSRRMFQTDMEHNRLMAERRGEERAKKLEGKRRKEERKETAKTFQSMGIPINSIVQAMNLTQDEIKTFGLHPEKIQFLSAP